MEKPRTSPTPTKTMMVIMINVAALSHNCDWMVFDIFNICFIMLSIRANALCVAGDVHDVGNSL